MTGSQRERRKIAENYVVSAVKSKASRQRCPSGKIQFGSRAKAQRALGKHRSYGGGATRVYRCPDCGEWHFTSKSRPAVAPKPPHITALPRKAKQAPRQPWEPKPARSR